MFGPKTTTIAALTIAGVALTGCGTGAKKTSIDTTSAPTAAVTAADETPTTPGEATTTAATTETKTADPAQNTGTPSTKELLTAADEYIRSVDSIAIHIDDTADTYTKTMVIKGTAKSPDVHCDLVTNKGGEAAIRNVGGKNYVKANKAFYKEMLNAELVEQIMTNSGGKYIPSPPGQGKLPAGMTVKSFVNSLDYGNPSAQKRYADTVTETTHKGQAGYKIVNKTDKTDYLVISKSTPRSVLVIGGNKTSIPGSPNTVLTFSAYNQVAPIVKPAAHELMTP